jgi:predicted PurR-regulated permease PerM
MQDQFYHIAKNIKVTPPPGAWQRLEVKLERQRLRRKIKYARIVSIAASILIIITVGVAGFFYLETQSIVSQQTNALNYYQTFEELDFESSMTNTMYQAENIRGLYAAIEYHNHYN